MSERAHKYWAFLSYSHADVRWTQWLHRHLEGYTVPSRLVGQASPHGPTPKHLRPVFRDREELSAATDLGDRLHAALQESACLVVICSRRSARSPWVEEEIRYFKSRHGEDRVLAVIVDGEPYASNTPESADQECFPRALRFQLEPDGTVGTTPTEPIAADLRKVGDGRRLALLKLISGILHVDLDHLVQRDARRRQRQMIAITAASVMLTAVFAALSVTALRERDEAVAQRAQAEGLVEFMIGDLRKKLEPAGRLDALDAVGQRALAYYDAQKTHGVEATALGRRARVLHMLGEMRDRRGDPAAALARFQEASRTTAELLRQRPDDPERIFDHAQSVFWVGYIALGRGQDGVARDAFESYRRLADRLVQIDPGKESWQAEVAYANQDLGSLQLDAGQPDEAAASFQRALAINAALARKAPADASRQTDLAQMYAWVAAAEGLRGHVDAALTSRAEEARIIGGLIAASPSDTGSIAALCVNRVASARLLLASGQRARAMPLMLMAKADSDRLVAAEPDDNIYRRASAVTQLLLAQTALESGDLGVAQGYATRALDLVRAMASKDTSLFTQELGVAETLSLKIAAQRADSAAGLEASLRPALATATRLRALSDARPDNVVLARIAAEAAVLAGDHEGLRDAGQARAWWAQAAKLLARASASRLSLDRAPQLVRQVEYRLRNARAPAGLLAAPGEAVTSRSRELVDYRW
ncbi:toll/interleukin-1 receptor domain-containing protein [Phenylobacterium sp.]|uniref:toll/interleukin-1 receptor domain-containing protein n=1 Tax=Phenylobacterium sp. TaxID=1871053 RepID=UPI0025E027C2|nr:toll/interleukin-1 receptor domain-containing protein [Phenylobacterium sp.]